MVCLGGSTRGSNNLNIWRDDEGEFFPIDINRYRQGGGAASVLLVPDSMRLKPHPFNLVSRQKLVGEFLDKFGRDILDMIE